MSLRSKILELKDIAQETVFIEKWGVEILIKEMNGATRAKLMKAALVTEGKGRNQKTSVDFEKIYPDLVVTCCYDPETGDKLFEPTDKEAVMQKSGSAIEQIALAVMKVNKLSQDEEEEAKKN